MIKNFEDYLYGKRLPAIYRYKDSKVAPDTPRNYPLKRFIQILSRGGFDELIKDMDACSNVFNVDKCPKEFLPLIALQRGLKFPFDMDEATQRRYVKILPTLYRLKGTASSFNYLGREIFGAGASISTDTELVVRDGLCYKEIHLLVKANGETYLLRNKQEHFVKFAENLRPVNTKIIIDMFLFYKDFYDRLTRVKEVANSDHIDIDEGEDVYGSIIKINRGHFYHSSILGTTPRTTFHLNMSHTYDDAYPRRVANDVLGTNIKTAFCLNSSHTHNRVDDGNIILGTTPNTAFYLNNGHTYTGISSQKEYLNLESMLGTSAKSAFYLNNDNTFDCSSIYEARILNSRLGVSAKSAFYLNSSHMFKQSKGKYFGEEVIHIRPYSDLHEDQLHVNEETKDTRLQPTLELKDDYSMSLVNEDFRRQVTRDRANSTEDLVVTKDAESFKQSVCLEHLIKPECLSSGFTLNRSKFLGRREKKPACLNSRFILNHSKVSGDKLIIKRECLSSGFVLNKSTLLLKRLIKSKNPRFILNRSRLLGGMLSGLNLKDSECLSKGFILNGSKLLKGRVIKSVRLSTGFILNRDRLLNGRQEPISLDKSGHLSTGFILNENELLGGEVLKFTPKNILHLSNGFVLNRSKLLNLKLEPKVIRPISYDYIFNRNWSVRKETINTVHATEGLSTIDLNDTYLEAYKTCQEMSSTAHIQDKFTDIMLRDYKDVDSTEVTLDVDKEESYRLNRNYNCKSELKVTYIPGHLNTGAKLNSNFALNRYKPKRSLFDY